MQLSTWGLSTYTDSQLDSLKVKKTQVQKVKTRLAVVESDTTMEPQSERYEPELTFQVARLRQRLSMKRMYEIKKNRCWFSGNNSMDSSLSSIDSDSSSFGSSPPPSLNTSTPMRIYPNLSDHSVNANKEFDFLFSLSPTKASTSSEEISESEIPSAPPYEIPKFEVTEDVSSTHSIVKKNHMSQNLLKEHSMSSQEMPPMLTDEAAIKVCPNCPNCPHKLPHNVHLPPSKPARTFEYLPPPPLPPRKSNSEVPPMRPPKLSLRT